MWDFKYLLEPDGHVQILLVSGIVTLVMLVLVPLLARVFAGKVSAWRLFFGIILVEYLFWTVCMTVLFRTPTETAQIELTPFWSYTEMSREGGLKNVYEVLYNVLFFVPLGVLVPATFLVLDWKKSLLLTVVFGFVVSASVEAIQYVTRLGFCETDDVIHNVLGCLIGWGVYWMIIRAKRSLLNN